MNPEEIITQKSFCKIINDLSPEEFDDFIISLFFLIKEDIGFQNSNKQG